MALPNIFKEDVSDGVIQRVNAIKPTTTPGWGKMNAAQMFAHLNVMFELAYENIHPKPNFFMKWMLKSFIKKGVVDETPYKKNTRTAPVFLIRDEKNFNEEKTRLINYIVKTQKLGGASFENKPSPSFGPLSTIEWNNMFYKHLDHHLAQFDA